jgi:hypothetical protein
VLYEKSKTLNWNAKTDLAWNTPVDPESEIVPDAMNPIFGSAMWKKLDPKKEIPNLRRHITSYVLSNFLHGEQGALLATAQIAAAAPTMDRKAVRGRAGVRRSAPRQSVRSLPPRKNRARLSGEPAFEAFARHDPHGLAMGLQYLGMQIMVEGLALGTRSGWSSTRRASRSSRTSSLASCKTRSRHVAFGVLLAPQDVRRMSPSELRDRGVHRQASNLLYARFLGQEVWENVGLPKKECEEAAEASQMMQLFRKLLFSKIVPNVKRLGLLTQRVRKGFEELGVLEYESWEPSE